MSHAPAADAFSSPTALIRFLWGRRYLLLLFPLVAAPLSYLYIRFFVAETFESTALLMLRTTPAALREGPRMEDFDPPVYEDLVRGDELLRGVVDFARTTYLGFPATPYEKLKSSFTVKTIMTRDTTVSAVYSPVVRMTVRAGSAEIAHGMATEWMNRTIERLGKLRSREAETIQKTFTTRYEELAAQAVTLARAEAETKLDLDALSQAPAPADAQWRSRQVDAVGRLETIRKDLSSIRERMADVRRVLATTESEALIVSDPYNAEVSGGFLVLSKPIKPEFRSAPLRSVMALGVAVGLTVLLLLGCVAEFYLRAALLEGRERA